MGAIPAGAKFQGELKERLKAVLNEVSAFNGQTILFIDSKVVWPVSYLDLMA
jgi:ATP-dependent Clp protease ATP-binding subunit ClpB